ncbi:MAG TPA: amino acid adenylation domain-containing protein, partial [Candidatus Obscuribacterales bacterium]
MSKFKLSSQKRALLELLLQEKGVNSPSTQRIPRRQDNNSIPLSFAQQRLWFLEQFDPGASGYNLPGAVRLQGKLNVAVLEESFNAIVQRHEALRTTFTAVEGSPIQVIAPANSYRLPLAIVDLRSLSPQDQEAEVKRLALAEDLQPFNLETGPLLRTTLLQLGEEEYVLLLTMHHIVADGWSLGVLIRELAAFYEAFADGKESPQSEMPIQYADFAVWQRQWLTGEILENQLSYWKKQLNELPPLLELPTDRPRPAIQTPRGATQSVFLSHELTEKLKSLSRQEDVTLFMLLLAAFKTLLYRYIDRADIVVGSPIANRNRAELEGLIGVFINTLVLRSDLSGNPSFSELLRRVREVTLGAYANQDLPFEKLVEELQPSRSLSRNPIFQVMFQLRNAPMPPLQLPGLTLSLLEIPRETTQFDLSLDMEEVGERLKASIDYSTDLFDAETIARMLGHFETLLTGIVAAPSQPISNLPLLTNAEQQQLLEWNNTAVEYPPVLIHKLFEAQVEKTPDAIAVLFANQELTYRELNNRANQLAHYLQKLEVKPEVLVGICIERSPEILVAILGILKAGAAYLPLDPCYPQQRLAFMLEDAQVSVLLTQQRLLDLLPESDAKVVCLDADWQSISQESTNKPTSDVTPDNLVYTIYTSGSTGTSKGVEITHRSLSNAYFAWEQAYQLRSDVTCHLQMASFSFDVFTGDMVRALCSGGKLVLCPHDLLLSPPRLYELMVQHQVDCAEFVPVVLRNLLQYLEQNGKRLDFMKLLICGSDSWYGSEYEKLRQFCDAQTRIINSFGVTEATIDSSYFETDGTELVGDRLLPIGKPFANTQLYILDRHLQPVPIGVYGELYVGGAGLARGYRHRPDLTIERFIPYPYPPSPQLEKGTGDEVLYKTGDIARYLPDGNIEFIGRIDNQVKIRGFRIELAEVEAVLSQHSAVQSCVVVDREDESGYKRLLAYVVAHLDKSASTRELRQFLQDRLPDYMVPATFVLLESLPLTPNGKLDRRSLPDPDFGRPDLETALVTPRSAVEEQLARIWAESLGLEQVGIHDNFFELGGDSILSIQIIAKANQAGLQLTPKLLFQHQTIAELATAVGTVQAIQSEQNAVTGEVPLTPIQKWFFAENFTDLHHWNQSVLLEVRESLNPQLLQQALQQLLIHHDALRLRFIQGESGWQQINAEPDAVVPFTRIDLSALSGDEQKSAIASAANEAQASLNLSQGSIIRVVLFDLGAKQPSHLLIAIHHLAVDGVSWRILIDDLQTAYLQLSQNQSIQLPPKTTSFKHWAEKLVKYAQSTELRSEADYWLTHLQKTITRLPVDHTEGTNTVAVSRILSVKLSAEETQLLLQEVPKTYRTQINDVLLTGLAQAFAEWTNYNSLLVDLEGHGREEIFADVDLSRTVGWFTSVFPVLLTLEPGNNPGEHLKSIKEQLRTIPNRGLGYGLLRYLSNNEIANNLQTYPQAEVSFNYFGQFDQVLPESSLFALAEDQEPAGMAFSPRGHRSYLLEINGFVAGGQMQFDWTYSEEIYQRATV